MFSKLRPGGGSQAQQSQTVASAGARGVNPDRDAIGGPNKKRVPVKIGPSDIAEFQKGIRLSHYPSSRDHGRRGAGRDARDQRASPSIGSSSGSSASRSFFSPPTSLFNLVVLAAARPHPRRRRRPARPRTARLCRRRDQPARLRPRQPAARRIACRMPFHPSSRMRWSSGCWS